MSNTPQPGGSFLWWCTEAATQFCNGVVAGFGAGTVVGGANAASGETMDPQQLTIRAAIGFVMTCFANGIKRVVVWHDQHPIPNPFSPVPTQPTNENNQQR